LASCRAISGLGGWFHHDCRVLNIVMLTVLVALFFQLRVWNMGKPEVLVIDLGNVQARGVALNHDQMITELYEPSRPKKLTSEGKCINDGFAFGYGEINQGTHIGSCLLCFGSNGPN